MFRIQKRTALPVWKSWLIRAIAIIIALVLNGVLIYGLTKMNPVKVYATMFNGVFGTERRIWNTIRDISMLLDSQDATLPIYSVHRNRTCPRI